MPYTSPFLSTTTGYANEVNLLDDLVREQIKLFGIDVLYLPRKMLNQDVLLHESTKSAFELAMPIPLYLKTFSGYNNGLELLTKFGVRSSDEVTFVMSRSEFKASYAPLLKTYYQGINDQDATGELDNLKGQTAHRPKEGDLIYFPFDDGIFEIKYVMFDEPFFQFGQGYVFEMQCERFEYSGETFSTGYEDIDDVADNLEYYKLDLTLETGGTGTFQIRERVTIYDLSEVGTNPGGDTITTEAGDALFGQGGFRMYEDPGFLGDVPSVEATVYQWDKPNVLLTIGDIQNQDPDSLDSSNDVTVNEFDHALVVGQTSGATWYTTNAVDAPAAFNDSQNIQTEFDSIKIIDAADTSPFGFV